MPDLLIEIGCEELPSSACREAIAQAPGLLDAALADLHLAAGAAEAWVAPRRIAVVAAGVADRQGGGARSVRGPAASAAFDDSGQPTKAAMGVARGQGGAVSGRGDPDRPLQPVTVHQEPQGARLLRPGPG
jgi:glycyl-tRNA synthetase beta subunit